MAGMTRRRVFQGAGQVAAATGALTAVGLAPAVAQAGHPAQSSLNGKLQVVQMVDWHPNHNQYLKDTITTWAGERLGGTQNLDLSDVSGFVGSTDIYQKLQAQKAAGQPVDLIMRDLSARILNFFQLTRDATPVVNRMVQRYGTPNSAARASHQIDGKWIGVPFYDRTGGYWLREDKFAEVGHSVDGGSFETWEGVKQACLAVSNPSQNFYGWGATSNRSGDGE
ncbi:MAG TPA: hypothetical protein VH257_06125, partial [Chloroflexota bacterium]|nr:hypothetical protein [Chloroflexota bacterium]